MALFNVLKTELQCPYCNYQGEFDIEFRFGVVDMDSYRLGEELIWTGARASVPKTRPILQKWCGEGYAECPKCHRDFWVCISVEDNVLRSVAVNIPRPGLITEPQ